MDRIVANPELMRSTLDRRKNGGISVTHDDASSAPQSPTNATLITGSDGGIGIKEDDRAQTGKRVLRRTVDLLHTDDGEDEPWQMQARNFGGVLLQRLGFHVVTLEKVFKRYENGVRGEQFVEILLNAIQTIRSQPQSALEIPDSSNFDFDSTEPITVGDALFRTVQKTKQSRWHMDLIEDAERLWNGKRRMPVSKAPHRDRDKDIARQYDAIFSTDGIGRVDFFRDEEILKFSLWELFRAVDRNCVDRVSWEDFVVFLIDTSMKGQSGGQEEPICEYELTDCRRSAHITGLRRITWVPQLGDRLLWVCRDSDVKLVDSHTLRTTHTFTQPDNAGTVHSAEFLQDHEQAFVVTSTSDLALRFFDVDSWRQAHVLHQDTTQTVVRWQSRWKKLFAGSRTGILSQYYFGNSGPQLQHTCKPHATAITDVLFMPLDGQAITCSLDAKICVLDPKSGKVISSLVGHKAGIHSLSYNSQYNFLISAGLEADPYVWVINMPNFKPFNLRDPGLPHLHPLTAVYAVPHSPQIISLDCKGLIKIWDIRNLGCVQNLHCEPNIGRKEQASLNFQAFCYMDEHKRILTAALDRLYLFEYSPGRGGNPLAAADQPVSFVLYNRFDNTILTTSGKDVRIWDIADGRARKTFAPLCVDTITACCIDHIGRVFYVGAHDGQLVAVDYRTGERLLENRFSSEVSALTYLPPEKTRAGPDGAAVPVFVGRVGSPYADNQPGTVLVTLWDGNLICLTAANFAGSPTGSSNRTRLVPLNCGRSRFDVRCLDYSANLGLFALGQSSNVVTLWRSIAIDIADGLDPLSWRSMADCTNFPLDSEITAVHFLEHVPLLCCADASGGLHLWSVVNPVQPVCVNRWIHHQTVDVRYVPNVIGFAYLPKYKFLYTADDFGMCTIYDLDLTLRPLKGEALSRVTAAGMKEIVRHWRTRAQRRQSAFRDFQLRLRKIRLSGTGQKFVEERPPVVKAWRAHDDSCRAIQLLSEPYCVLTGGDDCNVVLWTLFGEKISGLTKQGAHYDFVLPDVFRANVYRAEEDAAEDVETSQVDDDHFQTLYMHRHQSTRLLPGAAAIIYDDVIEPWKSMPVTKRRRSTRFGQPQSPLGTPFLLTAERGKSVSFTSVMTEECEQSAQKERKQSIRLVATALIVKNSRRVVDAFSSRSSIAPMIMPASTTRFSEPVVLLDAHPLVVTAKDARGIHDWRLWCGALLVNDNMLTEVFCNDEKDETLPSWHRPARECPATPEGIDLNEEGIICSADVQAIRLATKGSEGADDDLFDYSLTTEVSIAHQTEDWTKEHLLCREGWEDFPRACLTAVCAALRRSSVITEPPDDLPRRTVLTAATLPKSVLPADSGKWSFSPRPSSPSQSTLLARTVKSPPMRVSIAPPNTPQEPPRLVVSPLPRPRSRSRSARINRPLLPARVSTALKQPRNQEDQKDMQAYRFVDMEARPEEESRIVKAREFLAPLLYIRDLRERELNREREKLHNNRNKENSEDGSLQANLVDSAALAKAVSEKEWIDKYLHLPVFSNTAHHRPWAPVKNPSSLSTSTTFQPVDSSRPIPRSEPSFILNTSSTDALGRYRPPEYSDKGINVPVESLPADSPLVFAFANSVGNVVPCAETVVARQMARSGFQYVSPSMLRLGKHTSSKRQTVIELQQPHRTLCGIPQVEEFFVTTASAPVVTEIMVGFASITPQARVIVSFTVSAKPLPVVAPQVDDLSTPRPNKVVLRTLEHSRQVQNLLMHEEELEGLYLRHQQLLERQQNTLAVFHDCFLAPVAVAVSEKEQKGKKPASPQSGGAKARVSTGRKKVAQASPVPKKELVEMPGTSVLEIHDRLLRAIADGQQEIHRLRGSTHADEDTLLFLTEYQVYLMSKQEELLLRFTDQPEAQNQLNPKLSPLTPLASRPTTAKGTIEASPNLPRLPPPPRAPPSPSELVDQIVQHRGAGDRSRTSTATRYHFESPPPVLERSTARSHLQQSLQLYSGERAQPNFETSPERPATCPPLAHRAHTASHRPKSSVGMAMIYRRRQLPSAGSSR
eukprot:TRINITY_DN8002_c0_g1_i1.p1 TRINITY_DN8002_c0_g1~~TRINITY_DN8002_c0_g1_i1.p1  ORF type:complete len:2033 (-),score=233.08 TRINITY_DN8002_c0_g1_i1:33-6131(-)